MVNLKNNSRCEAISVEAKPPPPLARFPNLASLECLINSKVYHSFPYFLYMREHFSAVGASCARDSARKPKQL